VPWQDLEEVFCEDIDPLSSAKSSKKVTTQVPQIPPQERDGMIWHCNELEEEDLKIINH
jgi:hypothetical protein